MNIFDWYSGDKLLRRIAILAVVGATWGTTSIFDIFYILFNGSCFRKEKCGGNQREITSRN